MARSPPVKARSGIGNFFLIAGLGFVVAGVSRGGRGRRGGLDRRRHVPDDRRDLGRRRARAARVLRRDGEEGRGREQLFETGHEGDGGDRQRRDHRAGGEQREPADRDAPAGPAAQRGRVPVRAQDARPVPRDAAHRRPDPGGLQPRRPHAGRARDRLAQRHRRRAAARAPAPGRPHARGSSRRRWRRAGRGPRPRRPRPSG